MFLRTNEGFYWSSIHGVLRTLLGDVSHDAVVSQPETATRGSFRSLMKKALLGSDNSATHVHSSVGNSPMSHNDFSRAQRALLMQIHAVTLRVIDLCKLSHKMILWTDNNREHSPALLETSSLRGSQGEDAVSTERDDDMPSPSAADNDHGVPLLPLNSAAEVSEMLVSPKKSSHSPRHALNSI